VDSSERSDAEYVQGERAAPHVLLIRFTRSAKRNALSNPMVIELARLLQDAGNDPDIRAVVITGDEQAFSAGADLANMRKGGVTAVVNDPQRVDAWRVIEKFAKPMIAAVNGYALGAGNELAMCCDFVIAGRNAQFGQPEVKTGGMPGDGGTQRLPRKVGPNLAACAGVEVGFRRSPAGIFRMTGPDRQRHAAARFAGVIAGGDQLE
jgi:enoyl-CoA hydratase/carnithine racemase